MGTRQYCLYFFIGRGVVKVFNEDNICYIYGMYYVYLLCLWYVLYLFAIFIVCVIFQQNSGIFLSGYFF